jgi:hypothetical protein
MNFATTKRPLAFALAAALLALVPGAAFAASVGENYWMSFGLYAAAAGQFQSPADETTDQVDTLLAGGLGFGHIGGFSWLVNLEGGGLPISRAGQLRAEGRLGYAWFTLGPSVAQTIGSGTRSFTTVGPALGFDWPFYMGPTPRAGAVHLLGAFYRLDIPVTEQLKDFPVRHQIGVRFLFDIPELLDVFSRPARPWMGPHL